MKTVLVNQAKLTSECWAIQVWGIEHCSRCEHLDTEDCGGQGIRKRIKAGTYPAAGIGEPPGGDK